MLHPGHEILERAVIFDRFLAHVSFCLNVVDPIIVISIIPCRMIDFVEVLGSVISCSKLRHNITS